MLLSFSEKLAAKRAVKPFVFTHGLRMVRSAMTHRDPQAKQPHREPCIDVNRIVAPRRAIVHEHRVGKLVAAEGFGQRVLNRSSVLVTQSLKTQTKARVSSKTVSAWAGPRTVGSGPLKSLPKTIGHLTLEVLPVRIERLDCWSRSGRGDDPFAKRGKEEDFRKQTFIVNKQGDTHARRGYYS